MRGRMNSSKMEANFLFQNMIFMVFYPSLALVFERKNQTVNLPVFRYFLGSGIVSYLSLRLEQIAYKWQAYRWFSNE